MMSNNYKNVPNYKDLIEPTYTALKNLGGSGTNEEIYNQVIQDLNLSDDILEISHLGSKSQTELSYRMAWARTYLKKYGAITNSKRSLWSVTVKFMDVNEVDKDVVYKHFTDTVRQNPASQQLALPDNESNDDGELDYADDAILPDEVKPWRTRLSEILHNMDPFAFERLTQRLLRECGFVKVEVTSKSGDGGIDGTGKLSINGVFSFNVAFQCKRYQGNVGPDKVRDFRGSLSTSIEKGVLITTGFFTKSAKLEASHPGKLQIDLIDGEEFIDMLAEYKIGIKEVVAYEIDDDFFDRI